MSEDDIAVLFSPRSNWKPPSRWQRLKMAFEIKVFCNWFAIALHCRIKGHDYEKQRPTRCVEVTTCRHCGVYRGARYMKNDDSCRWYRKSDQKPTDAS